MTQKPLELSDLFPQYAVKAAIKQYLLLQENINAGKVKIDLKEESKEPAVDEVKMMNMTMGKLRMDFVKQNPDVVMNAADNWDLPAEEKDVFKNDLANASFKGYPMFN